MYQIVMTGQMGHYFMKANTAFCFDREDAAKFDSRDEAEAALNKAAKRGKKAMFASAKVEAFQ